MKGAYSTAFCLLVAASWASPFIERQIACLGTGLESLSPARAQEVRSKFESARIVPDTVPSINPSTELRVRYGNIPENLGNEFGILETVKEPTISFDPEFGRNPSTTKYTYIQVDPDAPGPDLPLLRHYLHHIVYDLQPSCIAAQTPKTQARYMPLTPLSVAAHRYVSLLYRQPPNYTPPPLDLLEDVARAPFNLQQYVRKAGLQLVAGNFMKEGLETTLCALIPGCTTNGVGYGGPTNGTALPTNIVGDILKSLPIKE